MELELRLAPPNNFVDKGFDLNDDNAFEENEVMVVKKRRVGEAFVKHHEVEHNACDNGGEYGIFYQDKVGDWLLAGDVPWQTFMESVQRIEIVRNGWDLK
nr:auxin-responsive protein IAA28-like isoform X1 [Ipomoea batatas]